jgi:hypothetical protein
MNSEMEGKLKRQRAPSAVEYKLEIGAVNYHIKVFKLIHINVFKFENLISRTLPSRSRELSQSYILNYKKDFKI